MAFPIVATSAAPAVMQPGKTPRPEATPRLEASPAHDARPRPSSKPQAEATPASPPPQDQVDPKRLASIREAGGKELIADDRVIEFSFDDSINRIVVKIKSDETGETVRQIPPEEYTKFLARFREMIGVLFDETA